MREACDWLVLGSGPGGAMTAWVLAQAGLDVLLVEEGDAWPREAAEPYSLAEMDLKWRNAGLTPSFGPTPVTYVEGRCLGGASEINAALYHPPVPEVLDDWALRYGIDDFGADALAPHVEAMEREVGVAVFPQGPGLASERLAGGARALGWKSREVARFWRYGDTPGGRRTSMSETLLPQARAAGLRVRTGVRVRRLILRDSTAFEAVGRDTSGETYQVTYRNVAVCCGAVQTALVLRRSGIRRGIGDTLTMNPMVRVVAGFDEVVNEPALGVPVQQVEEFKPTMTLGCSHSSLPHLAMWLVGDQRTREALLADWQRLGVFYAKVSGVARGTVRNVPLTDEAFVRYAMTATDLDRLGLAIERLARVLFAAGARRIENPVPGQPPLRSVADAEALRRGLRHGQAQVSTIHLHSSVPMGAASRGLPADSWGKLHGYANVWVNDASLLPDTPGINPQGTVLALARRNVRHWLGD